MFGKRIFVRALLALVFIALLAAGGLAIYQFGFAHGAMTNLPLPEGGGYPMLPYGRMPFGWHAMPRFGLLGVFPLLCFGGFFFLMLLFGFGFFARRHAWMHYEPGSHPEYWKHRGTPPWGPGRPPGAQDQPETGSETSSGETEESKS